MTDKPLPRELTEALDGAKLADGFQSFGPETAIAQVTGATIQCASINARLNQLGGFSAVELILYHAWLQVASAAPAEHFEQVMKTRLEGAATIARVYRNDHELNGVFDAQQGNDHRPPRP